MTRRVWEGVDVYSLWSSATPDSLKKLEDIGAIHNAKRLADCMDYCAEHYSEWEDSQESSVSEYADDDDY